MKAILFSVIALVGCDDFSRFHFDGPIDGGVDDLLWTYVDLAATDVAMTPSDDAIVVDSAVCQGCVPGATRAGNCDECSEQVCGNDCTWSACRLKAGNACEDRGNGCGGFNLTPCQCSNGKDQGVRKCFGCQWTQCTFPYGNCMFLGC